MVSTLGLDQQTFLFIKTPLYFMSSPDTISLEALYQKDPRTVQLLIGSLSSFGFALLRTDGFSVKDVLKTLQTARKMNTFRFPPQDEKGTYSSSQRGAFSSLFLCTKICLEALLAGFHPLPEGFIPLQQALMTAETDPPLFFPDGQGHDPFQPSMQFSGSFFNIFHYNFGLLNSHKDRGLLTAIMVDQVDEPNVPKTALWAQQPASEWINLDRLISPTDVIVFAGEELEQATSTSSNPIPAVVHCTRVHPESERLIFLDDRPDPESNPKNNRISVAFVLSHSKM